MIICKRCGTHNGDTDARCGSCGVSLGNQIRSDRDVKRAKGHQVYKIVIYAAAVVALIIFGPPAYHAGMGSYLRYHLKNVETGVVRDCDGPAEPTMLADQKARIQGCIDGNADLKTAKKDLADFTKNDKS